MRKLEAKHGKQIHFTIPLEMQTVAHDGTPAKGSPDKGGERIDRAVHRLRAAVSACHSDISIVYQSLACTPLLTDL